MTNTNDIDDATLNNVTTTTPATAPTKTIITTIIFDVDDTLYDVSTCFTAHRNGSIVQQFMVDFLHLKNLQQAKAIRDEYFAKYHSTAKALTVAQQEGRFPESAPNFDTQDLAKYWTKHLNYDLLGPTDDKKELYHQLQKLQNNGLILIAFSNGPRIYVKRVLEHLGLVDLFGEERLYAVDDVLPYCKPEREAFEKIFKNLGGYTQILPSSCIMVEDSMKNIRRAKELGLHTILVTGRSENERILPEDKPMITDPSVDCSIATIEDLYKALPSLWNIPAVFDPKEALPK